MEDPGYYNVALAEAARQFDVPETNVRSWLQRGALDGQVRDGQWWVHLGPGRGEEPIVRLWHGTSKDRVATLLERGFWTVTVGKQVWLTTNELRARLHAIGRAQRRHRAPVVVRCEVDLERYPIFWKPSSQVYVFHQPLGPEVITSIDEVDEREQSRRFRMVLRKEARRRGVTVGITKNSGVSGILFWINTYLDQHGVSRVTAENATVREVIAWVQHEYAGGRDSAITGEELEARAQPLLRVEE